MSYKRYDDFTKDEKKWTIEMADSFLQQCLEDVWAFREKLAECVLMLRHNLDKLSAHDIDPANFDPNDEDQMFELKWAIECELSNRVSVTFE